MSLRNRDRLIWIGLIVMWILWWLRYPVGSDLKWKLLSWLLVLVIGVVFSNILGRRSLRAFRTALANEDIPVARREHANLADFWRRRGQETIKAYGINILLLEERYQDAVTQLQILDRKRLPKNGSSVIDNQIAWCLVQLGEPQKGLSIAQSALPQLESMGSDYGASGHEVVGVGNLLIGNISEAIRHLEKAYASSKRPALRACAAFYLGEAYFALNDTDEAAAAYRRAYEALPDGKFGQRASERLKIGLAKRT
jgi:tetratricopeptide (TPR) repeat protein